MTSTIETQTIQTQTIQNQATREFTATTEAAARVVLLRELADGRGAYEERLGWPVTIDVKPGRLVMLTGPVADAVTMPAALGRLVLADLRIAMLAGPVVADPSGRSWMFFTAPVRGSDFVPSVDLAAELSRSDIDVIPTETYVVVPTNLDSTTIWPWIEPPTPLRELPPIAAVIATARRNSSRLTDRV